MSKIQKTIQRQKVKIAEGQFYEAHQQLRVIASRYIKQKQWDESLDVLEGGALALLQAGQGGSGGDLCLYFVEVLNKAERNPSGEEKGKLFRMLRAFPSREPTRRRFANEALAWTARFGESENGDPDLHHIIGTLYAEDHEPYDAERHLAMGTKDSAETLAKLEYEWYSQDDTHTAALYAGRAVFPYLLLRNLRSAHKAYMVFSSRLSQSHPALGVQDVSSARNDLRVFPSLPLLNFLGLLLLAIQRGTSDVFRLLTKHYAAHIKEVGMWDDALAHTGEIYFGIRIPKAGNPLFDMMGSMLFGGGGGGGAGGQGGGASSKQRRIGDSSVAPSAPPVDLD